MNTQFQTAAPSPRAAGRRIVFALLLLAAPAFAQVGEKITVNVIEVPVTVTGRGGDPLRGLTAANFELLDDGVRRPITSVEAVDFAELRTASAVEPVNPAARRSFMLLFDLGFSSPNALARAQEAARRFVRDAVQPRDLVAVGTISPEQSFRLLTAFTTDRDLVAAALAEPRSFRGTDPLQLSGADIAPPLGEPVVVTRSLPMRDEMRRQRNASAATPPAPEPFTAVRIDKEIDALSALASMLRAVPGRKQVVLLSEGFDAKEREGSIAFREMVKKFRASDCVLNAVDVAGVRSWNSSNDALFLLARPTGGEVLRSSELASLPRRQEVVYVLVFQAPARRRGQFHNLEVRLVGVPGARASYRSGYYESGGESPMQRTLSNAEIIVNDIPQNDVRIRAVSAAFPDGGERAQVPVIVEIDGAALLKDAAAEIYIYAFDQEGRVRDRLYQKMTLDLGKVGARLRQGGVKYYGTLSLPPGRYAVKTLVRAGENERRGFARTDVVVPRGGEPAEASFFIDERPGDWIMVKGTSHDPAAAYPFSIGGETFVPSARARRKLGVIVYNAGADELTTTAKVLRKVAAGGTTQFVIELDDLNAQPSKLIERRK
ncbi:MAG TPA: VWA domain-containing protein [Thermoanaerobaculia bacterium]|nr:VWA domain-containing protein [Thermoanaerobaculia bacterium]